MSVFPIVLIVSFAAAICGLVVAGVHAWREAQHNDREVH